MTGRASTTLCVGFASGAWSDKAATTSGTPNPGHAMPAHALGGQGAAGVYGLAQLMLQVVELPPQRHMTADGRLHDGIQLLDGAVKGGQGSFHLLPLIAPVQRGGAEDERLGQLPGEKGGLLEGGRMCAGMGPRLVRRMGMLELTHTRPPASPLPVCLKKKCPPRIAPASRPLPAMRAHRHH